MKKLNHEGIINMIKQSEKAHYDFIKHRSDFEKIIQDKLYLEQFKLLLKESLNFMNQIPNKVYGDNYKLCSKINKLLKDLK